MNGSQVNAGNVKNVIGHYEKAKKFWIQTHTMIHFF